MEAKTEPEYAIAEMMVECTEKVYADWIPDPDTRRTIACETMWHLYRRILPADPPPRIEDAVPLFSPVVDKVLHPPEPEPEPEPEHAKKKKHG